MAAKNGCLSFICNVLWFIFGGVVYGILWSLLGLLLCITIIGIPFGRQCFKFAVLSFCPFGKNVVINFSAYPIMNILWMIFFGWEMAVGAFVSGVLLCVTIIGIPFGLQVFKLAQAYLIPFGATIN